MGTACFQPEHPTAGRKALELQSGEPKAPTPRSYDIIIIGT